MATINVRAGDNLQTAVDAAQPGDMLLLDATARFAPITLNKKSATNPVQIISGAIGSIGFPPPNRRIDPSMAAMFPKILADSGPAIQTTDYAHHYTFIGIEVAPSSPSSTIDTLIALGSDSQTSLAVIPTDLVFDRCYIHALDGQPLKRGIALNSEATDILNCYISGFKVDGQDAQAVCGWNGPGPFNLINCYLEGAGENVMFGGAYSNAQITPADIQILQCLFSKPLSWNPNSPQYAGKHWTVKNLLELKNAKRVVVEGNTFNNCWVDAQTGYALLITPRGDQSGGSYATVSNLTVAYNRFTGTAQGIDVLGSDDSSASQRTTDVLIHDNLFDDVAAGSGLWGDTGGAPRLLYLGAGENGGVNGFTLNHNTVTACGVIALLSGSHDGFQFTNNIVPWGTYGIMADGDGQGTDALAKCCPGYVCTGNVIPGMSSGVSLPPGNFTPASMADVGFVDLAGKDYHLASTSPYKTAAPGCDIDELGTVDGSGSPPPPPPVQTPTAIHVTAPSQIRQGDTTQMAKVTVTAQDGSTPTGIVDMNYSGWGNFPHGLVNGQTVFTLYSLPPGVYTIQAEFAAQGKYRASASAPQTLTVMQASPPPPITVNMLATLSTPITILYQGTRLLIIPTGVRLDSTGTWWLDAIQGIVPVHFPLSKISAIYH